MDTGNLTLRTNAIAREILVDTKTGKARGVSFIDAETGQTYEAQARVVVLAASTLESARLMLLSKSAARTRTASAIRAVTSATTSAST